MDLFSLRVEIPHVTTTLNTPKAEAISLRTCLKKQQANLPAIFALSL